MGGRSSRVGREDHVPIGHITNGVHVQTWLAPQMRQVYDRHLGPDWPERAANRASGKRIEDVDDGELWETHQTLKARLIDFARRRAAQQRGAARRVAGARIASCAARCSLDALTIGFARRFATYKRANLILQDLEAIAGAGQRSADAGAVRLRRQGASARQPGKEILQQIARLMRDPRFAGKLVFIEDYDINVGRHLVQGVDVWLNNPRRPLEASGTSGQKVVLNGGLNLSVLDGWWAEAYDGLNGFAIGAGRHAPSTDVHDRRDARGAAARAHDEGDPALLRPRPRRPAARVDRADEAGDPDARLAVQRRPHGDGLRAEVLHPGRRRHELRRAAVLTSPATSIAQH